MHPGDWLLIGLIPTPADLERARQGWYRLPEASAPAILAECRALAFYQPRTFGAERWQIASWAEIQTIERLLRRDLLPDEPHHRRADEPYLKINLGPLYSVEPPLKSQKGRRLLFAPVRWAAFENAASLDTLLEKEPRPIADSLLYQLIQQQIEDVPTSLQEDEEDYLPDW